MSATNTVSLSFKADASQAKKEVQSLVQELKQLSTKTLSTSLTKNISEDMREASREVGKFSSILKDAMNALAGDPEFYDKFNKDLDTINKLQETVRRIKSGALKSKNPEEDLARMEAVLQAQQERLTRSAFLLSCR